MLQGVSPMIWRRLLVCGDRTIADLHYIVQIAMGWSDDHLHQFRIHGKRYRIVRIGGIRFSDDPDSVRLMDGEKTTEFLESAGRLLAATDPHSRFQWWTSGIISAMVPEVCPTGAVAKKGGLAPLSKEQRWRDQIRYLQCAERDFSFRTGWSLQHALADRAVLPGRQGTGWDGLLRTSLLTRLTSSYDLCVLGPALYVTDETAL